LLPLQQQQQKQKQQQQHDGRSLQKKKEATGGSAGMVTRPSLPAMSTSPANRRLQCQLADDPPGGLREVEVVWQHTIHQLDGDSDVSLCGLDFCIVSTQAATSAHAAIT
jgi:hypothetical protein